MGHRACERRRAGRARCHSLCAQRRSRRTHDGDAGESQAARCEFRSAHHHYVGCRHCRARGHHPARDTRAEFARGRSGACAPSCRGDAGDRLRQGHRARQPQIHDRGDRGSRTQCGAGHPVRTKLCKRRGARAAHRGDSGGEGRSARERAGAGAGIVDLPALSHLGCARRRDRRRGEERARHRGRNRHRQAIGRFRTGRTDHARFQRVGAARPRLRRARRNHVRPVRSGRSDPDLLQPAIAQSFTGHRARARRNSPRGTNSPKANSPHRC